MLHNKFHKDWSIVELGGHLKHDPKALAPTNLNEKKLVYT